MTNESVCLILSFSNRTEIGGNGHSVGPHEPSLCDSMNMLTPDLAFLPKDPISLPVFPDPFRTSTAFASTVVLTFDGGHHGCGHLVVALTTVHQ